MKTTVKKHTVLRLLPLFTLIASHEVLATDVSGTIVNQTWTSNNSPYRVVGDVLVAGLTIKPGVTVQFASNYVFEVGGVLTANGAVTAPIIFMGTNSGWQGIFFNNSSPGSVLAYCVISNSVNSGIRILNCTPTIKSCVIASNSARSGGGINADILSGNLTITDSMIADNSSYLDIVADRYGGGIYAIMRSNRLEMTACTVSNNSVIATTGYGGAFGGGCLADGDALFDGCVIISNSCVGNVLGNVIAGSAAGGGIAVRNGNISLNNSILRGNTASAPQQDAYGGGLYVKEGSVAMGNCIVQGNVASPEIPPAGGGGICIGIDPNSFGGGGAGGVVSGSIINSTIAYNQTLGVAVGTSSGLTLLNSIVFFNGAPFYGAITATYCDIQGGFTGTGNISANPVFLSTSDLIVVPGSPCVDRGSTNAAYNDLLFPPSLGKSRNDMGAHGGPGAGARMRIEVYPQIKVSFLGGVPGYNYLIQASTNLLDWQTVQQASIAHVGDVSYFFEPATNTPPHRFYMLNLAP